MTAFLDAGAPPVYMGFGSMPTHASTDVGEVAIEAVRAQGRRAVAAHGWAEPALSAQLAAVVHHGGAGTPRRRLAAVRFIRSANVLHPLSAGRFPRSVGLFFCRCEPSGDSESPASGEQR
ncbi:hypothetical protein ACGFRG_02310 [Streptomyces sp. NPDC048696]|uniref:hypothetical protein n=1 Tax=Streptomyces sp. NPDC048696 TaxID=3365585 RepID=UPI00371CFFDE